jgi:hypothetical protein
MGMAAADQYEMLSHVSSIRMNFAACSFLSFTLDRSLLKYFIQNRQYLDFYRITFDFAIYPLDL